MKVKGANTTTIQSVRHIEN